MQHPARNIARYAANEGIRVALALLACLVTAGISTLILDYLDLANIVMLFLLTVLMVATRLGLRAAMVAAVISVALFDFLFVPPRFSFQVSDGQYLVTLAVMLAVAVITSKLASDLQRKADDASTDAVQTHALYEMAKDLTGALTMAQVAEITRDFFQNAFGAQCDILLSDKPHQFRLCADDYPAQLKIDSRLAMIAQEREEFVRCEQLADSGQAALYLPLKTPTRKRGVIAVSSMDGNQKKLYAQQERLGTAASLVAIAIERVHYVDVAQRTQVDIVSERLRSSILSAISHDLRTPLTALVGLADSLVDSREALSGADRESAIAIRDQSENLAGLVSNLLDMARLHAGKVSLQKEWQPIDDVIGSSIKLLGKALAEHSVCVDLAANLPLVEIDAVLIERVFCNLLENAAKYSPAGSLIRLVVRVQGDHLEVCVIDQGQGFSGNTETSVFDMFVRGERESNKPGVGLGLAICRAIVEAHGGQISASNHPDGGACLALSLPLGNPPAIEEEIPECATGITP